MISESEAYVMVKRYIDEQCRSVPGGVAIMEDRTIRKPYGWILGSPDTLVGVRHEILKDPLIR